MIAIVSFERGTVAIADVDDELIWWCGRSDGWVAEGSFAWESTDCLPQEFASAEAALSYARRRGWLSPGRARRRRAA